MTIDSQDFELARTSSFTSFSLQRILSSVSFSPVFKQILAFKLDNLFEVTTIPDEQRNI